MLNAALKHPAGLMFLIASLLLAAAVRFVPFLNTWTSAWTLFNLTRTQAGAVIGFKLDRASPEHPSHRSYRLRKILHCTGLRPSGLPVLLQDRLLSLFEAVQAVEVGPG